MSDDPPVSDRYALDDAFQLDATALKQAVDLLAATGPGDAAMLWPDVLPETGLGDRAALDALAPAVIGGANRLGEAAAVAHMDPPTPWITWATTLWNAALNQNLLHPATAPVARQAEAAVIAWLAPFFGMDGGHMVPGSSLANLTGLWAARECAGVTEVVHSDTAHLSVAKAAHILGLKSRSVPSSPSGAIDPDALPDDLGRAALVLTAGTTSTGAIDDLSLAGRAAWTHVDAAWAGPMRLSRQHSGALDGIDRADSVAISAHKWLFQPKESALVFFRETARAHPAISFGGAYLATPNIGVQGSHGAVAVPLLATLLAWGREGVALRIERCMAVAADLYAAFVADDRLVTLSAPKTGVVVWRPVNAGQVKTLHARLPAGSTSLTGIAGEQWLRNVVANPNAHPAILIEAVLRELAGL